jgi:hypothetical protein
MLSHRVRTSLVTASLLWACHAISLAPAARSLPLYTRETRLACSHCHVATSQLTAAGAAFERNGDRLGGDAATDGESPVAVPFSVIATAGPNVIERQRVGASAPAAPRAHLLGDHVAELHTLLRPSPLLAFRFEAGVGEPDGRVESDLAYVRVDRPARRGDLDVVAGAFEADLPFLSNRHRTTLSTYLAPVSLDAKGFELEGRASAWAGGAGLISSQRALRDDADVPRALRRLEDTHLWVTYALPGATLGARMLADRQDSSLPSLTWMQHLQAEAGASFGSRRLTFVPAYVFDRFDDRPAAGIHLRHQYYLVEALAPLDAGRRWLLTTRYEHAYTTRTVLTPEADRQLGVANVAFEIVPAASVAIECTEAHDNVGGPDVRAADLFVRMSF